MALVNLWAYVKGKGIHGDVNHLPCCFLLTFSCNTKCCRSASDGTGQR